MSPKKNKLATPNGHERLVRFGDVVRNVNQTESNPLEAGLERYVGLEHIEPENLCIAHWGNLKNDNITFTRLFRKGQVLFGKRRAYQRKVAVASFDGVCSGDIYVFESVNTDLLPELLPFICQTDRFFHHAVGTSSGSLSPRTNWKQLADYEFILPPLDDQHRAVQILQSAMDCVATVTVACERQSQLERAYILDFFANGSDWPKKKFEELGDVRLGQQKHPKYEKGVAPRPYLRVQNVEDGYLDLDPKLMKEMDFVGEAFDKYHLKYGDILVTEGDLVSPLNVARSAMYRNEIDDCCVQKALIRFRPENDLLPEYALAACRFLRYSRVFARHAAGSTVSHLVARVFKKLRMPVAPPKQQSEMAEFINAAFSARISLQERLLETQELYRGIVSSTLRTGA